MGHVLNSGSEVVSYEYYDTHMALDIVGSDGNTEIVSFEDGIVETVVNNTAYTNHNTTGLATYGNYIIIKHPSGYKTLYAHLSYNSILVNVGDSVSKGQKIATMGQTGNAYGVHLHFEIRAPSGYNVNPYSYLFGNDSIALENDSSNEVSSDNNNDSIETVDTTENALSNDDENIDDNADTISDDDYLINTSYDGGSIVDGLKDIGADSSYDQRSVLAYVNGINDYKGTYDQNVFLLSLLKEGNLIKI